MTSPVRPHPMFGEPQPWLTGHYKRRMEFLAVQANPLWFRKDFEEWLGTNYTVWLAFELEADKVWDRGRRRYSARTIWEYMRHESMVREVDNEHHFKLNDHWPPDLARLYMLLHPDRDGFFERRSGQSAVRAR